MKTELRIHPDNGRTFLKTDVLDSTIAVAERAPLQLRIGTRIGSPLTDRVATARRLTGLAILRMAFGLIWAVDASLKWQPAFQMNFQQMLSDVAKGQPGFLAWWFSLWQFVVSGRAPVFGILTASTETYLALAVLTGFARKITYSVGILYGFFVWSVAEGFGGPYRPGTTTDVGAAIIYSLLFGALLLFDAGRYSVDRWIERRHVAWRKVAELRS
jgi:uncharacterized membrane protein YphA (DoxX/SURF4 family)